MGFSARSLWIVLVVGRVFVDRVNMPVAPVRNCPSSELPQGYLCIAIRVVDFSPFPSTIRPTLGSCGLFWLPRMSPPYFRTTVRLSPYIILNRLKIPKNGQYWNTLPTVTSSFIFVAHGVVWSYAGLGVDVVASHMVH